MSDYTPEQDERLVRYMAMVTPLGYQSALTVVQEMTKLLTTERLSAEHDRQVAERAWDEGLDAQKDYAWRCEDADAAGQGVWVRPPENPHRAAKGEQK